VKYYRVKPEYDNAKKYVWRSKNGLRCLVHDSGDILVANELYTPAERAKIANRKLHFEEVEIPKSKVYFFFGARFADAATIKEMKERQQLINEGTKQQAKLAFYND
jgi:hypothetical protein